ncbi:MAG TPA: ABC transporter substrate-binding protein [Stellaceae bacterium]|nr:ABC transporter substrate-binding protein [Stellaceae bacterium]
MRRGLSQGLLGGGLAALLLCAPATVILAQTPLASPITALPITKSAPPPAAAKPTAKTADKHTAPAHPTKVAAKAKAPGKKIASAKSKPAPKLAAKKPEPVKQATTQAPPSYTITTTRDHVAYTTTQVVPVAPPGTPAEKAAAVTPKPVTPRVEPKPAPPPAQVAATTAQAAATTPQTLSPPGGAAAAPTQAAATTPAASFLSAFLGKAFGIARDNNMTPLQRRALLADLFANRMDVSRIAGFTTSDKLTGEPTDFQRRFKTILISYLVETYYPRIELAADPSIKVDVTAASSLPDGTAVVWTTFTKSDWVSQSVKWHLVPEDGGFKIVDILSSGASLVQMERDTFLSVMRDGGLPQLMAKLDARTKALASAAP